MGMAITKQQVKTFSTGAIVIGLVLLPGLASFIQQQLLQRKMTKLNMVQNEMASSPVPAPAHDPPDSKYARLQFATLKSWLVQHITGMDKQYTPCFVRHAAGAKDTACPLRTSPTTGSAASAHSSCGKTARRSGSPALAH